MSKVKLGDRAPAFELPGTGGRTYRLEDFRESGVILAFYPGDFTPVCTRQFCSYRDDGDELEGLGVPLLGISPQRIDSHERFVRENGLTVPLLSDERREVARAYGVLGPGGFVRRSVFVIDLEGMVRYRHVSLLGLSYRRVSDIAHAVATLS